MTKYEFCYVRQYYGGSFEGLCTGKRKIELLVNSTWTHSMYWPKEVNSEWVERVQESIDRETYNARRRLDNLLEAQRLLDSLELEE